MASIEEILRGLGIWGPKRLPGSWLGPPTSPTPGQGAPASPAAPGSGALPPDYDVRAGADAPHLQPTAPGAAAAGPAVDPYDRTLPYPPGTKDALERFENRRKEIENYLHDLYLARAKAGAARAADPNSDAAADYEDIDKAIQSFERDRTALDAQIAAERQRKQAEDKTRNTTPEQGQTRRVAKTWTDPATGQTVSGTITEKYNNGVWDYVSGSATEDPSIPRSGGREATVITDGRGNYWTYDPLSKQATPLKGPQAGAKILTAPDGGMYVQNEDGTPGAKVFDALPQVYTDPDGYVVGLDRRNGSELFRVDTKTAEGRALANRLAEAKVAQAEREQFGGAVPTYAAEVARRQDLARKELTRLQGLQKQGQLSPEVAEAQFDQWMKLNVEGPLSGYRAAAEEERRKQEQENLVRTRAEEARVDTLNRQRETLAYQAGEDARAAGIELGRKTRAPAFISGLGNVANAMATGQGFAGFSPEAFNPANYKPVLPDTNLLAEQAVQRLLSRVSPAVARDMNLPLPALPDGQNLRALMDQVRYSGELVGAPQNETPLPGQEAIDLGPTGQPGRARTVYSNGRWIDWSLPG